MDRRTGWDPKLGASEERRDDVPTDEELETCLKALSLSKAVGVDDIPVEAYRASR